MVIKQMLERDCRHIYEYMNKLLGPIMVRKSSQSIRLVLISRKRSRFAFFDPNDIAGVKSANCVAVHSITGNRR